MNRKEPQPLKKIKPNPPARPSPPPPKVVRYHEFGQVYQPIGNIDTSKLKPPQGGTGAMKMVFNERRVVV
jgi:hypothetical protein